MARHKVLLRGFDTDSEKVQWRSWKRRGFGGGAGKHGPVKIVRSGYFGGLTPKTSREHRFMRVPVTLPALMLCSGNGFQEAKSEMFVCS